MLLLLLSLVAVVAISWYATKWLIGRLSEKGIVDVPNERTLHQGAIPRGGGLVIVATLLLSLVVMAALTSRYQFFLSLFAIVSSWSTLSWFDDRFDLSPRLRVASQCVFSIVTIAAFGYVTEIQFSEESFVSLSVFGMIATFIGIMWLSNLYNFMDGMDGLAASQTIIGAITLGIWFWQYGDQGLAIVCFVLAAASYGFLLWNWQPAKIFMGDVGSVTIGAFFSTLLVIAVSRYQLPVISFVLLFWVFVADASATVLHRIVKREKFWLPHRTHLYQRLATLGVAHNKIVIALIMLMLICSIIASITVLHRDTITLGIALVFGLFLLGVLTVVRLKARLTEHSL